ncbi:MAG: hypothetical protein ACK2UK_09970, partial [Candidatus Promineifilaceae bacterium]
MRIKILKRLLLLTLLILGAACSSRAGEPEAVTQHVRSGTIESEPYPDREAGSQEAVARPSPAAPTVKDADPYPATSRPEQNVESQRAVNPANGSQPADLADRGAPVVLLHEDFSGGRLGPEWEAASGEWVVANGRLTPVDALSSATIYVGDSQWRDYTISVRLEPQTDNYGGSIVLRAQDDQNKLKALFVKSDVTQNTGWWLIKEQSLETIEDSFVTMDLSQPPYTFTVVALGDYYALYVGPELVFEFRNPAFQSGRIGLESWRDGDDPPEPNLTAFDDLIVYEGDARAALGLQPSQSEITQGVATPTAQPPQVNVSDAEFTGNIGSFQYAVSDVTFAAERGELSSLGTFAMVTNMGITNPYTPMLEMQLFDAQGNLVGSGTGQILYIPSGATVPVAFWFEDGRPPFASYSIRGIDEGLVQYFEPVMAEVVPVGFQQAPCTTYTITNTDTKVATEVILCCLSVRMRL